MKPEVPAAPDIFVSKRLRAAGLVVLLTLGLGGLWSLFNPPSPRILLPLPELRAEDGRAWYLHLPKDKTFLSLWQRAIYNVPPGNQFNSHLILFEDGRALPQRLSLPKDIREFGAGRYAHDGSGLLFSTPLNDDPRSNGRSYEVEIQTRPRRPVYLAALLGLFGFLVLACPPLTLKMQSLLAPEWGGLKTAWAQHSGRPFPVRLWRAFLRPETTASGPGFPPESDLRPGFWTRTVPCLAVVMLLGFLASYGRAYSGMGDWNDALDYQAHGLSLAERGTALPAPLDYSMFLESARDGGDPPYTRYLKYPSLGFQLFIGHLGKWRGDYSQTNGLLVNAFFSVLFSAVMFAFAFALTGGRFLSVTLAAACLANPVLMDVAGRPLTDMSLVFFLMAAIWPMTRGRSLLAGFIFGLGYLFREVGLIFLPFLALASPKSLTLRGYARSLLTAGCGYAFWLAVNQGLHVLFRVGAGSTSSGRSWYLDALIPQLSVFDLQMLPHFWKNMQYLAHAANMLGTFGPFGFLLIMPLVFLTTPVIGRRLILIGLGGLFVSAAAMMILTGDGGVDVRYAAPAIGLFWTALALAVNRLRFRRLWFAALLVWALCLSLPVYANANTLRALSRPREVWAHITAPMCAKTRFGRLLKPGGVILSHNHYLDGLIYDQPVLVGLPDYETWRTSKGNELIDGITFTDIWPPPAADWPAADDVLQDAHGVRFVKFKGFVGDELDGMPPKYLLFLRER